MTVWKTPPTVTFPDRSSLDGIEATLADLGAYETEWDAEKMLSEHERVEAQKRHDADGVRRANSRLLHASSMISMWAGYHSW